MRIISRAAFLAQPPGTLYSEYEPVIFGDLRIKAETMPNAEDFWYQHINGSLDVQASSEFSDTVLMAEWTCASFPLSFDTQTRDEQRGADKKRYAIWELDDMMRLIVRMQRAMLDVEFGGLSASELAPVVTKTLEK